MSRFHSFPPSQFLLRILAASLAASTPAFAQQKQTMNDEAKEPIAISAEQMTGSVDRELHLERDVEVTRGQTTINADRATYRAAEDELEASGNIRMQRYGDRYTGDELKFRIDAGQGFVLHPTYRLERNNAQGAAERIDFQSQDQASVINGNYSTCEGPDPDWYLKAGRLDLDSGREEGSASNALLYFKHVPILGVPEMSFPLSDERKSGFLPPTIGTTNSGGLEVSVPYYFNIAPNRDLTLFPKYYAQRGIQWGADGRYLGPSYFGETKVEALFDDHQTSTNRYAVSSVHTHNFAPGFSYAWNINFASDNDYPNDFPHTITTSSQRLLGRDLALNYASGTFWTATARVSNFQVLQDPAAPIVQPYDRLPQLTLQAARYDVNGFDWSVDSEMARFWHPTMPRGDRFFVNPKIAYPVIEPGYFFTPKLALHASEYYMDQPTATGSRNLSRTLPTVSLDSGLIFERDASFFGRTMTQTLEPRLFYVYTPFQDQNAFPLFDTAAADLSFAQLFSENSFIGNDRISDANQLTGALISRYIENDGAERMRLAVGQRFYFVKQRVTLSTTPNESISDLLLSAYGRLTEKVSVEGNMQYSQTQHNMTRSNYGVHWMPAPKSVLNLQYRRDEPNNLEQADLSAQWPLALRLYGVGRVNYSLLDSKVAEALLGMEYKADCWIFRIVAQRIPTATGRATSALFLQLELNGLSRLGSNPMEALRTSIPGYQTISGSSP